MAQQTSTRVQTAQTAQTTRMEEYEIEVIIQPDGTMESTVMGVCGPDCGPLTEWLENIGEVTEHYATPDASRPNPQRVATSPTQVKTTQG